MKNSLYLALVLSLAAPVACLAQSPETTANATEVPTQVLYVSDQKTTHLVFPSAVSYVDLGNAGIIAAKATGSENIVRVKANGGGFTETNMTVLTAKGKLYSFIVRYQKAPKVLGLALDPAGSSSELVMQPLYVSDQKTTHLVFPYPVTYVDLGNAGIIAAKATGADNIVRVKSAGPTFTPTNMTVLTSGGKLYMFALSYQHDPQTLSYDMGTATPSASPSDAILSRSTLGQGDLDTLSARILRKGGSVANTTISQFDARAGRVGYKQETLFFPLHLLNKSSITYDIDFIKFYIQDKQVAKRTAEQAIEMNPIYVYNNNLTKIKAHDQVDQVLVFKKFTIPDKKQLIIEVYEKGGGRNVKLKLTNSDLLSAYTFDK